MELRVTRNVSVTDSTFLDTQWGVVLRYPHVLSKISSPESFSISDIHSQFPHIDRCALKLSKNTFIRVAKSAIQISPIDSDEFVMHRGMSPGAVGIISGNTMLECGTSVHHTHPSILMQSLANIIIDCEFGMGFNRAVKAIIKDTIIANTELAFFAKNQDCDILLHSGNNVTLKKKDGGITFTGFRRCFHTLEDEVQGSFWKDRSAIRRLLPPSSRSDSELKPNELEGDDIQIDLDALRLAKRGLCTRRRREDTVLRSQFWWDCSNCNVDLCWVCSLVCHKDHTKRQWLDHQKGRTSWHDREICKLKDYLGIGCVDGLEPNFGMMSCNCRNTNNCQFSV
eukprot:TRINITY_DN7869_c0_g1_i1.p1 TRINITY_DN7869_c0_g1~~TRINITY_DN7869_c0_g1_i1.p1  ORF type:complete len:339 (-),score=71.97 TRINITY_DN7869_c0_g1_i1:8-1024(-)